MRRQIRDIIEFLGIVLGEIINHGCLESWKRSYRESEVSTGCWLTVTYRLTLGWPFNLREMTKSDKSQLDPEHGDVSKVSPSLFLYSQSQCDFWNEV